MTDKTLWELIEKAVNDIDTYKSPDTAEVESRLDPILKAMDLPTIGNDTLAFLGFDGDYLTVRTEYYVHGGMSENIMDIPVSVLWADDPAKAGAIWAADTKVQDLEREIARNEGLLAKQRAQLAEAKAARAAL